MRALTRRQQQIDAKVAPKSDALPGVRIRVKCALEADVRRVRNVAGLLVPSRAAVVTTEGAAPARGGRAPGDARRRRPLRPRRPREVRLARVGLGREDPQRRRRQRLGHVGDARDRGRARRTSRRTRALGAVPRVQRRGARAAREQALRREPAGAARRHRRDVESRHGRATRRAALHRGHGHVPGLARG